MEDIAQTYTPEQMRPWAVRASGLAFALCAALVSFERFLGLRSSTEFCLCVLGFALFALWLTSFARFETSLCERAVAVGLGAAGALALIVACIPQDLVPWALALFEVTSAVLVTMSTIIREGKAALTWPGKNYARELMTFPVVYLCAYALLHALAIGLLVCAWAESSAGAAPRVAYSLGLAAAGVAVLLVRKHVHATKGLSLLTRVCLVALIFASTLMLLLPSASGGAFFFLAFGIGLLLFLVARMSLDLREIFSLAPWMPASMMALLFFGVSCGGGLGILLFTSGILPRLAMPLTLGCMVVIACVTVWGLSSDRVWTASELKAVENVSGEKRSLWRDACEDVARQGRLTPRETEVFMLMAKGRNAAVIEKELYISGHTVKTHTLSIYRKLDVHSVQQIIDLVEERKRGFVGDSNRKA